MRNISSSVRRIIPASHEKCKRYFPNPEKFFSPLLIALRRSFSRCDDFVCQWLRVGSVTVPLCRLEGLSSGSDVADLVVRPLAGLSPVCVEELYSLLLSGAVWCSGLEKRSTTEELTEDLLQGRCVLLFPCSALSYDTRSGDKRSIDEPTLERSLLGPRDSFTEVYRSNSALLRRHLRTSSLKLRELSVGTRNRTKIGIAYLADKNCAAYAQELYNTLSSASIASVTSIGDIEALLAPCPRGAFPQIHATERPDRMARGLLEGRVGILIDGIPLGLLTPCTLPELLRVAEDRSQHAVTASVLLLLRWAALLLSLLLPGLYLAVALYHQEMLPFELLQSIITAKQQVPFTTAAEILGMLGAFALLQEAGYRLPEGAGSSVSIIGSLIVGQSAVDARVVSPIAVIVVALAGIAGFTLPDRTLDAAVRLWRFIFVWCALCLGLYGLMAGFLLLLWRLCGMENRGVAYLYPLCDGKRRYRSTFLRLPLRKAK